MRRWVPADGWNVNHVDGGLSLARNGISFIVRLPADASREAWSALSRGVSADGLSPAGGAVIAGLDRRGVLAAELDDGRRILARHEPAPRRVLQQPELEIVGPVRLSPSACLRIGADGPELVGGRTGERVILTSRWAVEFAARLLAGDDDVGGDLGLELLSLLGRAGLLAKATSDESSSWKFHDAIFHAASRLDTSYGPIGAKLPTEIGQPPLRIRRPHITERIPLSHDELVPRGLLLGDALASRSSGRNHDGIPIGRAELSAVLSGSLRVRKVERSYSGELAWRPIPTGGARSGLGAVILVGSMADLSSGAYDYDAVSHELAPAAGSMPLLVRWFNLAERLTGISADTLQAMILFTLDYDRPAQAYDSIVYASALKEVGAALEAMALTSEDYGLSFCPLGCGFSTTAELGTGIAPAAVVGEAVLGRASADTHGAAG